MRHAFPFPKRLTSVRFFAKPSKLANAIQRETPWIVLDEGVPLPFALRSARVLRVAGGEKCKRWAELERILRWLASERVERSASLCAIGGGATLDLAACAASLYRRGMPLTLVPTTLLAMVDATLGGKTGVDLSLDGQLLKNFAGTFYPATEVLVLPVFLDTLPRPERVSGAGEVLKTLWIAGGQWKREPLLNYVSGGSSAGLLPQIRACLSLKGRVVESDPLDTRRVREILNFGHTVGHALESLSGRPHGECVLWGMVVETSLLGKRGRDLSQECREVIAELQLNPPDSFGSKEWLRALSADKKTRAGKIEMSVLERPGKTVRLRMKPMQLVEAIRAQLAVKRTSY